MKFQDSSTRSQSIKIGKLLERLKPIKSVSDIYSYQFNSKSEIRTSSRLRSEKSQLIRKEALNVDKLKHENHNIFVFMPSDVGHSRTQSSKEKEFGGRLHKFSSTRSSSKFSAFRDNNSSKNSFRVKKFFGLRQDNYNKQNRSDLLSGQSSPRALIQQSRIFKGSQIITQQSIEDLQYYRKKKNIRNKQTKPLIIKQFVNHTDLDQLQQKFKTAQNRYIKSEQQLGFINRQKTDHNKKQLFSNLGHQRIKSTQQKISFFLNAIFSHNPELIKRLFAFNEDKVKFILNYQGCFRSIMINVQNIDIQNKFIWSEHNSLWPHVIQHVLSVIFKKGFKSITIQTLYQMLTGLVLYDERILQILQSIKNSSKILIGQTLNGQFSTTTPKSNLLEVKRYILQTVYTQFQPSMQILVSYFRKYYRTICIADLYPDYYFIYKKINYVLGYDSTFSLQLPQTTSIIFCLSKQTIAFDTKIRLSIEQRKEEGMQQFLNQPIKSSSGFKKQLTLLPGHYCIKLSDDKENMKEYKFSIILSLISKKNISKSVKDFNSKK